MIISQAPVSKKYAQAYLNVYGQELGREDIDRIFAAFCFFKKHHDFMHLVCVTSVNDGVMVLVFEKLINYFSLPKSLQKIMHLLVKHKRVCYLKDVLQDICCLYKMRNNIIELEIKTADTIDVHAVQAFEQFFAQQSGSKIESTVHLDRSLIAGVRLQSDFFLWEYSVASRLQSLKQKLVIEG